MVVQRSLHAAQLCQALRWWVDRGSGWEGAVSLYLGGGRTVTGVHQGTRKQQASGSQVSGSQHASRAAALPRGQKSSSSKGAHRHPFKLVCAGLGRLDETLLGLPKRLLHPALLAHHPHRLAVVQHAAAGALDEQHPRLPAGDCRGRWGRVAKGGGEGGWVVAGMCGARGVKVPLPLLSLVPCAVHRRGSSP